MMGCGSLSRPMMNIIEHPSLTGSIRPQGNMVGSRQVGYDRDKADWHRTDLQGEERPRLVLIGTLVSGLGEG